MAKKYEIRPLRWRQFKDIDGTLICWISPNSGRTYIIEHSQNLPGCYEICTPGGDVVTGFKTFAEAKAHCQREHEKAVAKLLKEVK